jgi:hypothetical protein
MYFFYLHLVIQQTIQFSYMMHRVIMKAKVVKSPKSKLYCHFIALEVSPSRPPENVWVTDQCTVEAAFLLEYLEVMLKCFEVIHSLIRKCMANYYWSLPSVTLLALHCFRVEAFTTTSRFTSDWSVHSRDALQVDTESIATCNVTLLSLAKVLLWSQELHNQQIHCRRYTISVDTLTLSG